MSKFLLTISAIALLTLCSCKGRHADNTPIGETVEVEFPEIERAPVSDAGAAEAVKLSDTIVYTDTSGHTDSATHLN